MIKLKVTIGLILFLTGVVVSYSDGVKKDFPVLKGPYLGQKPPGKTPELFAPGIITTGMLTRDVAMTPDGKELYFCVAVGNYTFSTILVTKEVNGQWTEPEVVPHMEDPNYMNFEPCISHDGKKFFFLSNRPDTAKGKTKGNQDIWVMERTGNGWGEPYNLGGPVNTKDGEFFPSVTRDGTLYFSRSKGRQNLIYRSRLKEGKYIEPEKLPKQVNCGAAQYNAFIAPDESYIIVPAVGREDSLGGTDYYIVFRNKDDTWNEPINMGEKINTPGTREYSASLSPDGKYLFFMSSRTLPKEKLPAKLTYRFLKEIYNKPQNGNSDIYWIDAKIIEDLRLK